MHFPGMTRKEQTFLSLGAPLDLCVSSLCRGHANLRSNVMIPQGNPLSSVCFYLSRSLSLSLSLSPLYALCSLWTLVLWPPFDSREPLSRFCLSACVQGQSQGKQQAGCCSILADEGSSACADAARGKAIPHKNLESESSFARRI